MAVSLSEILAALQNGVVAVNGLKNQLATTFPQATTVSTAVRGSVGAVTFTSSQATGFMAVTTSSGFVGYVALYPSS
jgi:hypothetical protein